MKSHKIKSQWRSHNTTPVHSIMSMHQLPLLIGTIDVSLPLFLPVAVEDLIDAVLRLLATLCEPQVHVCDCVILLHTFLQLLPTILKHIMVFMYIYFLLFVHDLCMIFSVIILAICLPGKRQRRVPIKRSDFYRCLLQWSWKKHNWVWL